MSPEEFSEFYNANNTDGNKISIKKSNIRESTGWRDSAGIFADSEWEK